MIEKVLRIFSLPYKLFRYTLKPKYLFWKNSKLENSPLEKTFIEKLSRYKVGWQEDNKRVVLTQILEDHAVCIKLAATCHHLAIQSGSNVGLYSVHTKLEDKTYRGNGLWDRIGVENYYRPLSTLFLSFAGKVMYRNVYDHRDQEKVRRVHREIRSKIFTKEDILKVNINGILVGDLLYDTFLRYGKTCTADVKSPFLDNIIIESLNIFFNCEEIVSAYTITALVNTYSTYIHHGIMLRICLDRKIPVYTVGSANSLVHRVLKHYPSHSNNHFDFPSLFKNIEGKEAVLAQSKSKLENRFLGKIDDATSFMKQSSYSSYRNEEIVKYDWPKTVVVLAHCFFDSPHIYRDLIFPDFYEWMTYTLDTLSKQKDLVVLVKPHPNGIEGNDQVFVELQAKYRGQNVTFIDKRTSNIQLIESRPKAMITAYGTAGYEFAYHGIPVICIYDNPFTAYHFTSTANSIDEYGQLLRTIDNIKIDERKDEILEYYYMQHMFFMKGRDSNYMKISKYKGATYSEDFLADFLPIMNDPYFEMLDLSIKEGLELADWEYKQNKLVI